MTIEGMTPTKLDFSEPVAGTGIADLHHDGIVGYSGQTARSAAGITYRQLDYWARTGLVEPTVRAAAGSGTQRLYAHRDILVLKLVKRLLDTGVSLTQIRSAVEFLRSRGIEDLAQTTLMSDGATVYLCSNDNEVIDLMKRGQGVFGIAVGQLFREVESTLITLTPENAAQAEEADELSMKRFERLQKTS